MIQLRIEKNDGDQRLDRFLKKYLNKASLSYIYKLIRKDIKVNNKRAKNNTIIEFGDEITIYISEDELKKLRQEKKNIKTKKQFKVVYEDENMLIANKPFGLLTHGDSSEQKNTLANQVIDYLISKGDYVPRVEKTFTPAPANRLDRNTSGLVIFGKNAEYLKKINKALRENHSIKKYYLALVVGKIEKEREIEGNILKDGGINQVAIVANNTDDSKNAKTVVRPLKTNGKYTLVEVELFTGRTHQIRAHLAHIGHPILGDRKYGKKSINDMALDKFNLKGQFLHAYKLEIFEKIITSKLPENLDEIQQCIFRNYEIRG